MAPPARHNPHSHSQPRPAVAQRLALAAACLLTGTATAQLGAYSPGYGTGSAWDRMRPIDPGMADLGPLGTQTRLLSRNLRRDRDFGILYQGLAADGSSWFARRDAGITAIFPRSAYAPSADGEVALIPPDTTFIIGEPASAFSDTLGLTAAAPAQRDPSNGLRLDGRIGDWLDSRIDTTHDAARPRHDRLSEQSPQRGMRALLRDAGSRERASR